MECILSQQIITELSGVNSQAAVDVMNAQLIIIDNRMSELLTKLNEGIQHNASKRNRFHEGVCKIGAHFRLMTQDSTTIKSEIQETEIKVERVREFNEAVIYFQHDQSQSTSSLNECDDKETESEEHDVVSSEERRGENKTGSVEQEIESVEEYHSSSKMKMDADESDDNCLGSDDVSSFDSDSVPETFASSNNNRNNAQNQSKTSITPNSNIDTNSTFNEESNTVDDDETISFNNFSMIPITTDSTFESNHLLSEDTLNIDGNPARSRQTRRRSLQLKKKKKDQQEVVQMEPSSHSPSILNNNGNNSRSQSRVQRSKREKVQKRRQSVRSANQEVANGQEERRNDARPHQCDQCGKTFKNRNNRYHHIQMVHNKKVNYHCTYCQKGFYMKGNLIAHERTHTGEKPFQCDICKKSFSRKDYLKAHKLIHSGEKPFHCNSCSKSFAQKSNLIVHERIHSGIKPYQCSKCHKRFTRSSYKNKHERKCQK